MRVPLSWLKEYVHYQGTPEDLARQLTMAGIAVEQIDYFTPEEAVLELELTPNRADCLGIINVAREVAAITGAPLFIPLPQVEERENRNQEFIRVSIEAPDLCSRYIARIIQDIRVAPSPSWMQNRLLAAGIRPINNVVDITNYVMLETGQPLHAFDYHQLMGQEIIVRRPRRGEVIYTLDGGKRALEEDMLVIADAERAVAVAGVMGGLNSEVTPQTRTVLLEAAYFDRVSIRQTSRKLGLRTESSLRFEKGVDLHGVAFAAERAVQLMQEIGAGVPVVGTVDCYLAPWQPRVITLAVSRCNQLLGTKLSRDEIAEILRRLHLEVDESSNEVITVKVPSYRGDLEREVDLIEEVARLYGYDRIPATLPVGATTPGRKGKRQQLEEKCREILMAAGMTEVITFSFMNPAAFDRLGLPATDYRRQAVMVANPLNEDQRIMRTTLLPNLLEVALRNHNRRIVDAAIFEVGRIFFPSGDTSPRALPQERLFLGGVAMGEYRSGWNSPAQPLDFFYLKGVLEELLDRLMVKGVHFEAASDYPPFHPGRVALIKVGGQRVGVVGEVHPQVQEEYGFSRRVVAFELDLEEILKRQEESKRFVPLARFPEVKRDLAVVVREEVPAAEIEAAIYEAGQPLLVRAVLFDVYKGGSIPAGSRSMAYSLTYQALDRTLTDAEVNEVHQRVVDCLAAAFGAQLR